MLFLIICLHKAIFDDCEVIGEVSLLIIWTSKIANSTEKEQGVINGENYGGYDENSKLVEHDDRANEKDGRGKDRC